ncbi:sensor histidine kinase [Larkinella soli]|uniref:sensor histidine kinase n=1 Tax=Larkinella soli TaxID=1770527 RepID=UPI000FFC6CCD|nr:7TM diverse intracellular signaling domain-containing protein [Larkinella soli]
MNAGTLLRTALRLCLLPVLLATLPAPAQSFRVRDPDQVVAVYEKALILKPERTVSIQDLLSRPESFRFQPVSQHPIVPKSGQFGYWLTFDLTNETDEELFLQFIYNGTRTIDLYETDGRRVLARHALGALNAETRYPVRKSNPFCALTVRNGQTHRYYVYFQGVYTKDQPIYCLTTASLVTGIHRADLFFGLFYGLVLAVVVYSLLLYARVGDRDTLLYVVWVLFVGLQIALFRGHLNEFLYAAFPGVEKYGVALAGITGMVHIPFTITFLRLRDRSPGFFRFGMTVLALYVLATLWTITDVTLSRNGEAETDLIPLVALLEGVFNVSAGVAVYRRGFRPASYFIIGNLFFFLSIFIFLLYAFGPLPHGFLTYNSLPIGSALEITFFAMALASKINLLKRQRALAVRERIAALQENEKLIREQNTVLEQKVKQRTAELQQSLKDLQTTQAQLIHQEKMASLGELTAGIAHEIQNPLNFVNNFSEVSTELIDDLKKELAAGNAEEVAVLADDLSRNLVKIAGHGKRAGAIVRGMLEHSRPSTGKKESVDLNALADQSLQLSFHSQLSKNGPADIRLVTDFDPALGPVLVVPEDIGRLFINLFNNAFYAVRQKAKQAGSGYRPEVKVQTLRQDGQVLIRVNDNGAGIPEAVRQKIFQPFFTTKPTGEGTGLGLSLSYDIVTREHGGELTVSSREGEFTEFMVRLPG